FSIQLENLGYEVDLLSGRDVKTGMSNGSIMLSNTFHPDRLLYIDPESDDAVFEQSREREDVVSRTRTFLNEEQGKIDGVVEGAQRYGAAGNDARGTFVLHQRLELTLRAVAYIMVGWQLRSHSITKALHFLSSDIPHLRQAIEVDNEEVAELLTSLDRSYK